VRALRGELDSLGQAYRTGVASGVARNDILDDALLGLLLARYEEAFMILLRILEETEKKRRLHHRFLARATAERKLQGQAAHDNDADRDALIDSASLSSWLHLDIKSLYLWTNEIQRVFTRIEKEWKRRGAAIDLKGLRELKRITFLRNKVITHLADQSAFPESGVGSMGMRFDRDVENIQLLIHPPDISRVMERPSVMELMAELETFVPSLEAEANYFERIRIVYENLHAVPDVLRTRAEELLVETGLAKEPPYKIGAALLDVLREYHTLYLATLPGESS
jgi:hypothetical protein